LSEAEAHHCSENITQLYMFEVYNSETYVPKVKLYCMRHHQGQ